MNCNTTHYRANSSSVPGDPTRNLIITFLLTGLWHGANWTFVMFGAWNGFMLIIERIGRYVREKMGVVVPGWARIVLTPMGFLYTSASTIVSFIFFRAESMSHAREILARIAGGHRTHGIFLYRQFLFVAALMVVYHALSAFDVRRRLASAPGVVFLRAFFYTIFVCYMLSFAPLATRSFIYFQF